MDTNPLDVIVGGNYGSEGKGAVSAHRIREHIAHGRAVLNVRVGGPNAGHTVVHPRTGNPMAFRHVPVGMVYNHNDREAPPIHGVIAAGSEIDLEVLLKEVKQLHLETYGSHRSPSRLPAGAIFVDRSATVILDKHVSMEEQSSLTARTGSTAKGVGAARAERIWRNAFTVGNIEDGHGPDRLREVIKELMKYNVLTVNTSTVLTPHPPKYGSRAVVIEGTQGYQLGLHGAHYPQSTSNDCRAIDFLSQAGISPWATRDGVHWDTTVWVASRVYPIRVAGNSGDIGEETTWEELGLPEEYTTVTKKVRRVARFDRQDLEDALVANGAHTGYNPSVKLALTMTDQVDSTIKGENGESNKLLDEYTKISDWVSNELGPIAACHLSMITTSDRTCAYVNEDLQLRSTWEEVPLLEASQGNGEPQSGSGDCNPGDGASVLRYDPEAMTPKEFAEALGLDQSDQDGTKLVEDLFQWWTETSNNEAQSSIPKSVEYGVSSLKTMGDEIITMMPSEVGTRNDPTMVAIWCYVVGKLGRWSNAVRRGEQVNPDTLHDIAVYVKMAQRIQQTGTWVN